MHFKNLKNRKAVLTVLGCMFTISAVVCGILFGVSYVKHKNAVADADAQVERADNIRDQMVTQPEESAAPGSDTDDSDPDASDGDIDGTSEVLSKYDIGQMEHHRDENLRERINFGKLDELIANEDVHSWLYLPDTPVDYLVMQGDEEEPLKYLWKDIYGDDSKTGSLFVRADDDINDDHMVIYGHRLKDHSVYFGPLLEFRDTDYADAHKYAYTYDRSKATKWELVYAVEGDESDPVYMYPYEKNSDEWRYLDEDIKNRAFWTNGQIGAEDNMLVLSTCSGPSVGMPQRLYLVYRDVCFWEYE